MQDQAVPNLGISSFPGFPWTGYLLLYKITFIQTG
jgi:hypothetical protein